MASKRALRAAERELRCQNRKAAWIEQIGALVRAGVDGQSAIDQVLSTVMDDMKNSPQTAHEIKASWLDLITQIRNKIKETQVDPSLVSVGPERRA